MLHTFYRAVLPETGQFCLLLLPEARHIWASSLEELVDLTETYQDRAGVYFGTSAFQTSDNRKQANVLALRSLRLDIDAGPAKLAKHGPDAVYATQKDALAASIAFFKATHLVPSYIVSSGAGLHIYFCFDDAVTPQQWLPLAKALSMLGVQHGFKVDPSVTEDSARILRPIGAIHHDDVRVSVLKATGKVYDFSALSQLLGAFAPARTYDLSINADAISTFEGPPSSAFKIVEHCAALREAATSGGNVPEPFWRAMLGLVKHTVEGSDAAHEWSQGYDGYDAQETERKLAAWSTGPTTCAEFGKHCADCVDCQHRGSIKSPIMLGRMTLEAIEALPEEVRPVLIPEPVAIGAPWDGKVPPGFEVIVDKNTTTLVHHQLISQKDVATGENVPSRVTTPVTHEVFWFAHWADAESSEDAAQVTLHKWDDMLSRVKAYSMPVALLASRGDLAKQLGEFGIQITTDKRAQTSMEHYAKAQFQRIKNISRRLKVTDRFGLRVLDDGRLVAVHGSKVLYPDGTIREAMLGNQLRGAAGEWFRLPIPPAFDGEWGPEVWDEHIRPAARQHVEFMRKHYNVEGMGKYQLAFMLGLASPLMAFVTGGYDGGPTLPPNGLSVSLFERDGGRGKTALMHAALLAYGEPSNMGRDQNETGSTVLARIAKLSMLGTMPACFDEMGRVGEKASANLISAIANGSGRDGATKEMGLRTTAKWALICLIATNRSQRDMVAVGEAESSAVQYRLLELDVSAMPTFDLDAREAFAADWARVKGNCAGALGAVIQQAICSYGVENINQLVLACVARASRLIESGQEDRFQYRALGAMLALQVILGKLGLAMFDTKLMLDEFNIANENAKNYVKDNTLPSDGMELLSRALHDLRGNTVVTEIDGNTKGNVPVYAPHVGSAQFPRQVDARYVKATGLMYVSVEALRAWCVTKHIRDTDIIAPCRASGVLRAIYPSRINMEDPQKFPAVAPHNLLRGMRESTKVQVRCYAFSMHRLSQCLGRETSPPVEGVVVPLHGPVPETLAG